MIQQRIILIAVLVLLTGCHLNTWDTGYIPATGYRYHGTTPLSKPHGYNKTIEQEIAQRHVITRNADAWKDAAGAALSAIIHNLNKKTPLAVIPANSDDVHDQVAVHYVRDILLEQDFLVGLIEDTSQYIMVDVNSVPDRPELAHITIQVLHETRVIARKTVNVTLPDEYSEDGE